MRPRFPALVLATVALPAQAQDYSREQRWQEQVLSNLVVGEPVRIGLPERRAFLALYTEGQADGGAVLLVHGIGVHPDHGIIGILRVALAESGLSTLSIQMPVLAADARADDYLPLFPEAAARIAAAADWLSARGHRRIVLLSHSLGSSMSQHYLQSTKAAPFAAWICMGFGGELALPAQSIPVLDVYGTNDNPAVLRDAVKRRATLHQVPGGRQIVIAAADHFYTGKESELTEALLAFITTTSRSSERKTRMAAFPNPVVTYSKSAKFEDVRDELKLAIADKGLVIDYESFVNRMLERTGKDVGSTRKLYVDAQAFVFCSAALSRKTMEADPANIAQCPYSIVVYATAQAPEKVNVSYRRPWRPDGSAASTAALKEVEALLDSIARRALGLP
jgi:uncharacterized protein (DUF302 family)